MAVFTLFAYGTGDCHEAKQDKSPTNNIISKFSRASSDLKLNNGTTIDGPGNIGLEVKPNATTGADKIIEWLKRQGDSKNTINITGFSRGSVTSIYIANILKEKQQELEKLSDISAEDQKLRARLKNLDLNLFLIDPVAGLSDKAKPYARIIPDNVKNYVAVLQLDERRRDFKPQDISRAIVVDSRKTKVTMLPFYGNHTDNIKIKSETMESGAKILWYSIFQFLTEHGSTFDNNQVPEFAYRENFLEDNKSQPDNLPVEPKAQGQYLLNLFSQHHQERSAYRQSGMQAKLTDGVLIPRTDRTMNQHLRFYVKQFPFFVNQLERELFKVTYPAAFNYLFEMNRPDPRFNSQEWSKESVSEELAVISETNFELFQRMKTYKLVDQTPERLILGNPSGYYHQESLSTINQIFPHLIPDSLENIKEINAIEKLNALEAEVYRMTFRYQREKHEFNFAGKRSQSVYAIRIRNDINELANLNQGTAGEKYSLMLDKLEDHYKKLILSDNFSDLTQMTGLILASHGRRFILNQTLGNELLVHFVYAVITLVKLTVEFVGTLGYVGGSFLYALGNALDSIGERTIELVGDVGSNPFKAMGFIAGSLLLGIGLLIKNGFGLRPINNFLVQGIREIRDLAIGTINSTKIEVQDPKINDDLEKIVDKSNEVIKVDITKQYKKAILDVSKSSDLTLIPLTFPIIQSSPN